MARLPVPGNDEGVWGDVLNDYLSVVHETDGTLKVDAVDSTNIQAGSIGDTQVSSISQAKVSGLGAALAAKADDSAVVHDTGNETVAGVKTFSSSPIVPTPVNGTEAANKDYVDSVASAGTPDATAVTKGKLRLTGDLGGTADSPTVPGLSSKEPTITAGTTAQYWRGDKSWQTLDKAAVGLANVDNTSDANKPVSTATQTALNAKANSSITVTGTTSLTGGGDLTTNRTLSLVNDSASPGNSQYYGTDGAGTKGYFTLPAGGSTSKTLQVKIMDDATILTTGDAKFIFAISAELNGMDLTEAQAYVTTVSSSGNVTAQVRNITNSNVDMLSTPITIDANENTSYTAAVPSVVNTSNDNVATGNLIAIDIDAAGTGAKGFGIILTFAAP